MAGSRTQDTGFMGGMANSPIYQGQLYEPSTGSNSATALNAISRIGANDPAKRANEQANRNLIAAGYGVDEALIARLDWTLQQQRSEQAAALQLAANNEMKGRLALEDGAQGSFYNADHTFNMAELKDFYARYNEQMKGWEKGFISQDMQQDAVESVVKMRNGLNNNISALLGAATKQRARAALDKGFNSRLELGDYNGAMQFAIESLQAGACAPGELQGFHRKAAVHHAKSRVARATNPDNPNRIADTQRTYADARAQLAGIAEHDDEED